MRRALPASSQGVVRMLAPALPLGSLSQVWGAVSASVLRFALTRLQEGVRGTAEGLTGRCSSALQPADCCLVQNQRLLLAL